MATKTKDDSQFIRLPLIPPGALARASGISPHGLRRALTALGIEPCRTHPSAQRLLSVEEASRVVEYLRSNG